MNNVEGNAEDNVQGNVTAPTPAAIRAISVTDLKCDHLPNVGLFCKRPGNYYVKLFVDKDVKKTAVAARGNTASWNETLYFKDLHGSSVLHIEVYGRRIFTRDECIGFAKERIEILVAEGATGAVPRTLHKSDKAGNMHKVQTVVEFTLTSFKTSDEAQEPELSKAVNEATAAVDNMNPPPSLPIGPGNVVDCATPITNTAISITSAWGSLLDNIRLFTEIVDKASEIHPYAKAAWSILSLAHKTIIDQMDRDDSIHGLAKIIGDTYAFVQLAEPLKKIESQKPIFLALAQQTLECSYFVRAYAKTEGFWKRTAKNLVSDVDSKIKQYQESFDTLQLELQRLGVIHTEIMVQRVESAVHRVEITVLRVLNVVEEITGDVQLNDMPYADGAGFDPEKGCLRDTRETVLAEIWEWANRESEDAPRIFFLNDVAGAGKSTVAHEVAKRFSNIKRLGSSYFFDRALQVQRSPENVFSTIARDLADLDPQRKASLLKVVGEQKSLRTTRVPREQFQKFILDPSKDLTAVGPSVIVIDALDESGDEKSRHGLLSVLSNEAAKLPSNFRVLITSRAEEDIQGALRKKHVLSRSIRQSDPNPDEDISLFVQAQLSNIPALDQKWPNQAWCTFLVEKSEGLFQWASTACLFIKGDGLKGSDPVEQLDILLASQNMHLGWAVSYNTHAVIWAGG